MTKAELIEALAAAGSDEPRAEAKIILEEIFGVPFATQQLYPDREYDEKKLREVISQRGTGEPLQYIIGHAYFCREKYILNSDCLIPRQDTELLVYKAAELLPPHAHFADLCTGTGCVAISTLCERKDTTAEACDVSEGAVAAARENARLNGVSGRLAVYSADIFKDPLKDKKYNAILSNPPYIPTEVVKTLDREVLREPHRALDGGEDGLDFYRYIIKNFKKNLADGGFFAFEIGYDQGEAIVSLGKSEGCSCEVFRDVSGMARVAILYVNQEKQHIN